MIAVQAETARLTTPGLPRRRRAAARRDRRHRAGRADRDAAPARRAARGRRAERDGGHGPAAAAGPAPAQRTARRGPRRIGPGARLILRGPAAPLDPGVELAAYRIVQEALTNARRHAPGAAVDVELHYADDALRLRIRDNGPGPAGPASRRARAARHARAGRRGRRELQTGAARRRLPRRGQPAQARPGRHERQPPASCTGAIGIVVADDHEMVRTGFAALLATQPDFTVVGTAADGAEAVRVCREQRPDVVLMDVRMPGMDGIEATRQLAGAGERAADPDPDHVRPRRVRLRRAARRGERLPAQGRHRRAALRRGPGGRGRRRAARAGRHPPAHRRVRPAAAAATPAPAALGRR